MASWKLHHDVIQFICFKVQRIWLFNYASDSARPWRSSWIKARQSLRRVHRVPTLVKLWTERSITHPFLSYRVTVGHPPSAGYSVANEKCINMKEFKPRPRKESIREIQQAHFWDLLLLLSCVSLFSLLFDLLPLCKYFISEVLHFDL